MRKTGFFLVTIGFLGLSGHAPEAISAILTVPPGVGSIAQSQGINWPSNTISLQDIENLFNQYPGIGQLHIQFPNRMNWNVSPAALQQIVSNYQQEAQVMGLTGKLPDLSFSSLVTGGIEHGLAQLSVNNPNGDFKSQMDEVLQQLQMQQSSWVNILPDWLKNFCMMIYDAVYSSFDYLGAKLAGLITR